MTHEHHKGTEAEGGPEKDSALPDAETIPVADGPFDLEPIQRPEEWEEEE